MSLIGAVKKLIPTSIKQPVRNYIDASTWRNQAKLSFDPSKLRSVSTVDVARMMSDPTTAEAFKSDQSDISTLFGVGEVGGGVNPGDRRAIYHLVLNMKPMAVLEVGTHVGASTLYIAKALSHFGGRLTTVDIQDVNRPDGPWREYGLARSPRETLVQLGLESTVAFVHAHAENALHHGHGTFDLIFLDGDHASAAVYREIAAALRILAPNGLILLHDFYPDLKPITPDGGMIPGPARAAGRIRSETSALSFIPLGNLSWPTKGGGNATSLALVAKS